MPRLALSPTGGYYADPNRHWSAQDCVNYLPMKAERAGTRTPDQLRQCPGLRPFAPNLGGALRGLHNVEGKLFAVGGTSLYRIKSDVVIPYGTVPGTARVSMAHNAANELLTVNGSAGYLFNTASLTLDKITDEGYPGASVVGFVDQYFPQVAPNGAYWFWSDLSNGAAYNTLDRAEAEADPDRIVTLFVSHREVLVFGRDTIEPFINTGAATGTFQRAANTVIECGCAARFSVAGMDNAVFFLDDKRVVRVLRGVTPERISNAGIEQALGECTSEEISRAFAMTWEDRGHKCFILTVPGRFTFAYDLLSGEWHRKVSPGMNTWRITALEFWEGQWIGGDAEGKLYVLDWDYHYDGQDELIRERVTGVLAADQRPVTVNEAELLFSVGGPASELDEWPEQPEPPTITGDAPTGTVGVAYTHTYTLANGTPPYSVALREGTIPAGLTLSTAGVLSGTPTTVTPETALVVRVTDANGLWDDLDDEILIEAPGALLVTNNGSFDGTPIALELEGAFTVPAASGIPVVRVSPNGLYAAHCRFDSGGAGGQFGWRKWDEGAGTWSDLSDPADMPTVGPTDMAWSSDSQYLAVGVFDTSPDNLIIYRRTGDSLAKVAQVVAPTQNGYFVAWSADDSMLAVGNGDSAAGFVVFDVTAGVLSNARYANTGVGGMHPAFSPDGTHVAAASRDSGGLFVYSIGGGSLSLVDSIAITDPLAGGGTWWGAGGIVTVADQNSAPYDFIRTFTFDGVTLTQVGDAQTPDACTDSSLSPDGQYLVVACEDGNAYVYDLDTFSAPALVETVAITGVTTVSWGLYD